MKINKLPNKEEVIEFCLTNGVREGIKLRPVPPINWIHQALNIINYNELAKIRLRELIDEYYSYL